jgi:preprotein translocase subunit SecA
MFERMLGQIREGVTRTLAFAQLGFQQPEEFDALPGMPDFITHHIDPFTGEDDTADIDASTGNILSRLPPLQMPQPDFVQSAEGGDLALEDMPPVSRNAPCPCGSGLKFKHCHGQLG